jgi:hypothetical protein
MSRERYYATGQHLGPIKNHLEAIERWPDGAFAFPTNPRSPTMTAACRGCGKRCNRLSMRCRECENAERLVCKRGHDLTDPAVARIRSHDGARYCRVCDRIRKAIARAEGRAA